MSVTGVQAPGVSPSTGFILLVIDGLKHAKQIRPISSIAVPGEVYSKQFTGRWRTEEKLFEQNIAFSNIQLAAQRDSFNAKPSSLAFALFLTDGRGWR